MSFEEKFQLIGWILFILCAILFIISGLQTKDMLLLIGSIIFLLACLFFIIPLLYKK